MSANLILRTVDVGRVKGGGGESRSHFNMLMINKPQDIC